MIDANVVILSFAPDTTLDAQIIPVAEAARSFLLVAVEELCALHVPWVFFSEVTNTITRQQYAGNLTLEQADLMLESILGLPWLPSTPRWGEVVKITRDLGRAKSGDSEYLAVAIATGATLITADERLGINAKSRKLTYPILPVLEHPWAK